MRAFADEYLRDLNGTAAYLRIHPGVKAGTASTESHRTLKNPKVRAYIAERRERLELEADFTKADLVRELVAIVRADPREVSQMRQVSCGECWPEQEQTERKALPMWQEPNPECEHCHGEGIPKPWFADVRKLSPAAARLFQSVHVTRDGMKINLRDQDAALEKLAKILGAYELDNKQKDASTAEVARQFFAQLHRAGAGRLPIAPTEGKPQGQTPDSAPLGGQG